LHVAGRHQSAAAFVCNGVGKREAQRENEQVGANAA
jgi:hypothetical protein